MLYFGKTEINSYEKGSSKEWFLGNGRGGYASSTAIGVNVSERSGLLVVEHDNKRVVLLSKLDERVVLRGKEYPLYTNRYRDMVYPDGYRYIQAFSLRPYPAFTFVVHDLIFIKEIFFLKGKGNTILVRYIPVNIPGGTVLKVSPIVGLKYIDESGGSRYEQFYNDGFLKISSDGFNVYLFTEGGEYKESEVKYENVMYDVEGRVSDLWSPGEFEFELSEDKEIRIAITDEDSFTFTDELLPENNEVDTKSFRDILTTSAGFLVVDRRGKKSILSDALVGEERMMDAAIAFPGIMLSTGRFGDARDFLLYWLDYESDGEIPDSIRNGKGVYINKASALWYLYACSEFLGKVKDRDFWKGIYKSITRLVNKKLSIVDSNYMLILGKESNWMAESVDRTGALVEINALWYNAAMFMVELSEFLEYDSTNFMELADNIKRNFNTLFWNEEKGYLYDFVDGDTRDDTLRANQVLAVGLTNPVVEGERLQKIVDNLWTWLYTTYGLRTLDPRDKRYKGRYDMVGAEKTKAMYRGMAWPWLLGFFINAVRRCERANTDVVIDIFLEPFYAHLREQGLGFISQMFDGSMPYKPHGLRFSAASVGEILRCYVDSY